MHILTNQWDYTNSYKSRLLFAQEAIVMSYMFKDLQEDMSDRSLSHVPYK
jgi:hypothetical protein